MRTAGISKRAYKGSRSRMMHRKCGAWWMNKRNSLGPMAPTMMSSPGGTPDPISSALQAIQARGGQNLLSRMKGAIMGRGGDK